MGLFLIPDREARARLPEARVTLEYRYSVFADSTAVVRRFATVETVCPFQIVLLRQVTGCPFKFLFVHFIPSLNIK